MEKLRDTTLLFLVRREGGEIHEVCLAMKKRGFGVGRWNGVGGKLADNETIEEAVMRETNEEIGVAPGEMHKVAELTFRFPHNPAWDQLVHVYLAEVWEGEPTESEEMNPAWYTPDNLPFNAMWPDDPLWLPLVLAGKLVRAAFSFGEGDVMLSKEVDVVEQL